MLGVVSKQMLFWSGEKIKTIKERHRGKWHWMETKKVPLASLNRSLWRSAESSSNYYLLLFLSGAIATFGLLSNSSATVIGAMIVAPLMGPIEGMSFAMVMANRRLLKRSALSLTLGALLTVLTATVLTHLIGIEALTDEISARTQPTLMDLGVALAAGATGALAKSRRGIADALPGVAIAVALVPPLSVIGVGIAFASSEVFWGSLLLFLTNLAGIIFSGGLVFLAHRYGSVKRAKRGLMFAIAALVGLAVPLSLSFQDLALKKQAANSVNEIVRHRSSVFTGAEIQSLSVQKKRGEVTVYMDVEAIPNSISGEQIDTVREQISTELNYPVSLNVSVIPMEQFSSEAPPQTSRSIFNRRVARLNPN